MGHRLIMGKIKNSIYCLAIADIWIEEERNVPAVVFYLADLGHMTKMAATPIYGKNP